MRKALFCLAIIVALSACSNSGGESRTPTVQPNPEASLLPNYSAEVERIQGEDPRDYFIGNMPALNAVDADGDGIWDDIQARLAADPIIAQADPRAIRLIVQWHQGRMLYRASSDTQTERHKKFALGISCLLASDKGNVYWLDTIDAINKAIYVSKPRVLASIYADGLASGNVSKTLPTSAASCDA